MSIKHAAVITFPEHMTKEECDDILRRMAKAGYCETVPTAKQYNDDYASPVLYFP